MRSLDWPPAAAARALVPVVLSLTLALLLHARSLAAAGLFYEVESFTAPSGATMMIYSPQYQKLLLKNSASAIVTVDLNSYGTTTRLAGVNFTDMSISPSGRYVFAADYGGENIGYGTPANPNHVHRLDLATGVWEVRTAYIAGRVQAVSDSQLILQSLDQWVTLTNNAWGTGLALTPLNTPSGYWGPGYYGSMYSGNIRYLASSARLLHGNSGSSSQEIKAFRLLSNEFVPQEHTGVYGSASGYGGTTTLATDGSAFYYGRLQVDPLDVSTNRRVFAEPIVAASAKFAFGDGKYYDALTGSLLGTLPFSTTVYALNPDGSEFWAYDPSQHKLRRFVASSVGASACGSAYYPFPYTDVAGIGDAFCPGILESYVLGVTRGTSATTFSPADPVNRVQMTTFLQRSVDQALLRSNRRTALNQSWTPGSAAAMQSIAVSGTPRACAADGGSIWIPAASTNSVHELQASNGKVVGTWTSASGAGNGVAVVAGRIFATGQGTPGHLYMIDPALPPGPVALASSNLGNNPGGLAFDGTRLWSANQNSVSIIALGASLPYAATTISTGFTAPSGIVFDGTSIWVTDSGTNQLLRLNSAGVIMQSVPVGSSPRGATFDGANLWVPNAGDNSLSVVQAKTGTVIATINADLATNRLSGPTAASFDGERIVVTNATGNSVTAFRAADLAYVVNVDLGAAADARATCSDGINVWIPMPALNKVMRF